MRCIAYSPTQNNFSSWFCSLLAEVLTKAGSAAEPRQNVAPLNPIQSKSTLSDFD